MVDIDYAQIQAWIALFFWPFVRIAGFLMAAPLLGHTAIPAQVKIALSALISVILAPVLPPMPDVGISSWAGLGLIVQQLLIGVGLGLVMRIFLTAVQAAGEFIALQMGIGFATFFSSDSNSNSVVISRLFYMITLLIMLAMNAHLIVIEILASTFQTLPIGMPLNSEGFSLPARYTAVIFSAGLLMSLPVVAPLLIIKFALGILNRSAPQFTVFSIGFPMSLIGGLVLMVVMMSDMGRFLEGLFTQALGAQRHFIESLSMSR